MVRLLTAWKQFRNRAWLAVLPLFWQGAVVAACPTNDYSGNMVIVVSVGSPPLAEGPRGLSFADRDAGQLAQAFEAKFTKTKVFGLNTANATTANVTRCLAAMAEHAQAGSKTVIFISARGYRNSTMKDGFLLTSDGSIEKLPSKPIWQARNAIPFGDIMNTMGQMRDGAELYLLLDLCRYPAEASDEDNLINKTLLDPRFLTGIKTRRIILASRCEAFDRSYESYFADSLVAALEEKKGSPRLEEYFSSVSKSVVTKVRTGKPIKTRDGRTVPKSQTPQWPTLLPLDQSSCPFCVLNVKEAARRGPLLASAVPFLPWGDGEVTDETATERGKGAAAEERGQAVFIRYGEGNHFYGDPLHACRGTAPELKSVRLCAEEFASAAEAFRDAAKHYRKAPSEGGKADQALLDSLKERAEFCFWHAALLRAEAMEGAKKREQLDKILQNVNAAQYAESHNLRGIAWLEMAKYAEAEAEFQKAIDKAPFWAYPRHNLALAMIEHGNYAGAERAYRAAIRTVPIREKIPDSEPSKACFGRRAVVVGARPYLYYNLAVLLQRLNRLGEARQEYCRAQLSFQLSISLDAERVSGEKDPDQTLPGLRAKAAKMNLADVNNSLGVLFMSKNRRERARAHFNLALSNDPKLAAAHFNLARLQAPPDKASALEIYEKARKMADCSTPDLACKAMDKAIDELKRAK